MSDSDQSLHPLLQHGDMLPAFTLPGADGMPHSPWTYKQRENLVLLFLTSPALNAGRAILQAFARQYADFREERCAILVITAVPVMVNLQAQEELRLPFPLLADAQGEVISRYTRWQSVARTLTPSVVLADRYNAVYRQWLAEEEAELPSITELLESLQYLNGICTP